jgi:hypothetical protein
MPKETSDYLAALGPYADKNYLNAPMDLQGNPYPPTVLPVGTNMPQSIPPPSTGAPQMDEYESMKIFNPYVQMALGMLAGNSGVNKSQAFANAVGGGLGAVQTAQTNQQRQAADKRDAAMHKLKLDEYERMKTAVANARTFAAKMAKKGGPMADFYDAAANTDDPSTIMKIGALQAEMEGIQERRRYNDVLMYHYQNPKSDTNLTDTELFMKDPELFKKKKQIESDASKEGKLDPALSAPPETFVKAGKEWLGNLPGYNWIKPNEGDYKIGSEKKQSIIMEAWNIMKRSGDRVSFEDAMTQALSIYKTPKEEAEQPNGIVTDSKGQEWKYNGSGDKKDIKNYTRVE